MKPTLQFLKENIQMSNLGEESSLPDIMPGLNVQNKTIFELEEEDEIYEGYGKLEHVYPYRQYNCYDRKLSNREMETAVLENKYIQAVFLPELGGRLWRLIDKITNTNLLYTNDVIRPSNLATRNAWFSGGVEWNIGVIGHTPLTMEPLFTAQLEDGEGNPVLRMYEFERIRGVVYQMDFWLEKESKFLNCRMRIVNDSREVIPMYWWSNMAVPEYKEGRVLLPAEEAYTSDMTKVYKVDIPMVKDIDVTKYNQIPDQVDYFFHIPKNEKKYIANLNNSGYGLLHLSTERLQSRKLFVWGHNNASIRWQEFLTEKAGEYIEIQAGLGKTQYGCIPMAPHTAWEWVEQYGPVKVNADLVKKPFEIAKNEMNQLVDEIFKETRPEHKLSERKKLAKTKGKVIMRASGYANLENYCRKTQGERQLCDFLDFSSEDDRQLEWKEFLRNGYLKTPSISHRPADFTKDEIWFSMLKKSAANCDKNNWYAHYQLALQYFYRKDFTMAEEEFDTSISVERNPWALHGLAVCHFRKGNIESAAQAILDGMKERMEDLSYIKEGMNILLRLEKYKEVLDIQRLLSSNMQSESRIHFNYIQALAGVGRYEEALHLLVDGEGIEIADIREGDIGLDKLWTKLCMNVNPEEKRTIPHKINFTAL